MRLELSVDRQEVTARSAAVGQLLTDKRRLADESRTALIDSSPAEISMPLAMELLQHMETHREALAAALVRTQEQERQRIASYIHDESIQAMAVVGLRLQVLRDRLTDPTLIDDTASIEEVVSDSIARLRNLIIELDPGDAETGLARALRSYMGQYFRDSGISFGVRGRFSAEPPAVTRRALYRIVHEALVNVRKHASAARVTVTLSANNGDYVVTVVDDGRGFDVDTVRASHRPGHLGLRLMCDRARLAGGSVDIKSAPRGGTTVVVRVPKPAAEMMLIGERQTGTR